MAIWQIVKPSEATKPTKTKMTTKNKQTKQKTTTKWEEGVGVKKANN